MRTHMTKNPQGGGLHLALLRTVSTHHRHLLIIRLTAGEATSVVEVLHNSWLSQHLVALSDFAEGWAGDMSLHGLLAYVLCQGDDFLSSILGNLLDFADTVLQDIFARSLNVFGVGLDLGKDLFLGAHIWREMNDCGEHDEDCLCLNRFLCDCCSSLLGNVQTVCLLWLDIGQNLYPFVQVTKIIESQCHFVTLLVRHHALHAQKIRSGCLSRANPC